MLVLSRKVGDSILINDNIEVTVTRIELDVSPWESTRRRKCGFLGGS